MFRHWKLLSVPFTAALGIGGLYTMGLGVSVLWTEAARIIDQDYRKVTEIGGAASIVGLCLLFGLMLCGAAIYIHWAAGRADLRAAAVRQRNPPKLAQDAVSQVSPKAAHVSSTEKQGKPQWQAGRWVAIIILVAAIIWVAQKREVPQAKGNIYDQFDPPANQAKSETNQPDAEKIKTLCSKPSENPIITAYCESLKTVPPAKTEADSMFSDLIPKKPADNANEAWPGTPVQKQPGSKDNPYMALPDRRPASADPYAGLVTFTPPPPAESPVIEYQLPGQPKVQLDRNGQPINPAKTKR